MGDECTCEKCRAFNERPPHGGEWLIKMTAAVRGLTTPKHENLLVVDEGGISLRLRPSGAVARAAGQSVVAAALL